MWFHSYVESNEQTELTRKTETESEMESRWQLVGDSWGWRDWAKKEKDSWTWTTGWWLLGDIMGLNGNRKNTIQIIYFLQRCYEYVCTGFYTNSFHFSGMNVQECHGCVLWELRAYFTRTCPVGSQSRYQCTVPPPRLRDRPPHAHQHAL